MKCHWNGDIPTKSHNFGGKLNFFPHGEYSDWLYLAVCFRTSPAQFKGVCAGGEAPRHEGAEIHHVTEEIPAGDRDSSSCCWRLTHKTRVGLSWTRGPFPSLSLIYQPPSGYLLCGSQALLLSKFAERLFQLWLIRRQGREVLLQHGSRITASLRNVLSTFLLPCTKAALRRVPVFTELHVRVSLLLAWHKMSFAVQKAMSPFGSIEWGGI